jgi:hypothetical protein
MTGNKDKMSNLCKLSQYKHQILLNTIDRTFCENEVTNYNRTSHAWQATDVFIFLAPACSVALGSHFFGGGWKVDEF